MANILITGGTGFVGHWLKVAKPDSCNTYNIGRERYEAMGWYREKWDGIIHAALTPPTKVLECAKRDNCRVLFVSSGIVYHPEFNPKYRQIKIDGERECLESGADTVIARLFTFCGDRLDDNKAISTFYAAALKNEPLVITGDGSTVRSYLHGSVMAFWLWRILQHGARGEAYDVGSDEPVTMFELAQKIIKETGSRSDIEVMGGDDPMPRYLPENIAKTEKIVYNSSK